MKIKKTYQGVVPTGKVLNAQSNSQNDTYSCGYINEFIAKTPKTIWEGVLYGGQGRAITLSNVKRYIRCYVDVPFESKNISVCGSFTIDTEVGTTKAAGSIILDEGDTEAHINYYVISTNYDKNTKQIWVNKAGYINVSTGVWNDRLSSSIYRITKIETYD